MKLTKRYWKIINKENIVQGKNILITGGTDGMGKATAHQLAKMGAQLLLIGRNGDKGEAAAAEIIRASGSKTVTFLQTDLSLIGEVQRAAEQIRQIFNRLDVIVHGAGGTFPPKRTLTDEGLESSFAVQYLARFALTNELLDLLNVSPAPQVLRIAGGGTASKSVEFDNLQGEKRYDMFASIAKASVTNDLLTLEQITRYPKITFYNYGPGMVRTATLMGNLPMRLLFSTIGRPFTRSAEQAADDIVTLLTGEYPGGFYGHSLKQHESPAANSNVVRLWDYSLKQVDSLLTQP
jgi:NAD(P)-dependent dehydrogenase (short-subunit alcohol dehydrogenase family)